MVKPAALAACAALLVLSSPARLQGSTAPAKPPYEPELARSLGADENGMKSYVLVILKTGPNQIPAGPDRDEMFKGHFANMNRLAPRASLPGPDPSTAPTAGAACSSSPSPTSTRRRSSRRPIR